MGTQLQKHELAPGSSLIALNVTHPQWVADVHRSYLEAGSRLILTNTFEANANHVPTGMTLQEIIQAAVQIARQEADSYDAWVGLDISPLGQLLEPSGTLTFDDAYLMFAEQVQIGVKAGVDCIYIETMSDLLEAKCAVLAAKEHSDLPIICTMSFEASALTFMGVSASCAALTLSSLGVSGLGLNCSVGPEQAYSCVEQILQWTNLPVFVKPNAGMPTEKDGKSIFALTDLEFAKHMERILALGVNAVGGCCGTTPSTIQALSQVLGAYRERDAEHFIPMAVCSARQIVTLDPVRVVGERINPTGKKDLQDAIRQGDMEELVEIALEQVEAGADILDINVYVAHTDEAKTMPLAVSAIQNVVSVPLQIDSTDLQALEAGLRACNGRPILNSVRADTNSLQALLPIAARYGAVVIGLTIEGNHIPESAAQRVILAERIMREAHDYGITDVLIDCLSIPNGEEAALTSITRISRLGVKTILGISNISYKRPHRSNLNRAFLEVAMDHGLCVAILNPNEEGIMDIVKS
jgi:5-methyltetrahydrofolate--homocysteine methyltransferase